MEMGFSLSMDYYKGLKENSIVNTLNIEANPDISTVTIIVSTCVKLQNSIMLMPNALHHDRQRPQVNGFRLILPVNFSRMR